MFEQSRTIRTDKRLSKKVTDIYDDGVLRVEYENYHVTCRSKPVKLSRANFLIIATLVKNLGEYVPADKLWQQLWDKRKPLNPESLKVHICGLRQILSPFNIRIKTKTNNGYRLIPAGN